MLPGPVRTAAALACLAFWPFCAAAEQATSPEYGRPSYGGHPAVQGEAGAAEASAPDEAVNLTGRMLIDRSGQEVGEIEAVLDAAPDGAPAAVVDRGGRFSIGTKRVLAPTERIRPGPEPGYAVLDMSPEEIAQLPQHAAPQGGSLEDQQVERRMEAPERPLGAPR